MEVTCSNLDSELLKVFFVLDLTVQSRNLEPVNTVSICNNTSHQILVPRTSRGRPIPTSPKRYLEITFHHPRNVSIWQHMGVSSRSDMLRTSLGRRSQNVSQKTFKRFLRDDVLMSLNFVLLLSLNLIHWSLISKYNTKFRFQIHPFRNVFLRRCFLWNYLMAFSR